MMFKQCEGVPIMRSRWKGGHVNFSKQMICVKKKNSRAGWHHLACPPKMSLGITYYITDIEYIFI